MSTLRFSALDTWFFREARPFDAIGGSELASIFPPPPRTLMGAVRTAIGDALGADWPAFGMDPDNYRLPDDRRLRDLIGFGDDYSLLKLQGPWLTDREQRLYPMPLCVLERSTGQATTRIRLRIGKGANTPLGRVRLPELPPGNAGAKTLERVWLTAAGLTAMLDGGVPHDDEIRRASDLFVEEARLGIARDNKRRVAGEGLLYQTRHLRPKSDLAVEADVALPDHAAVTGRLVRFGGEGRLAHLDVRESRALPQQPKPSANTLGLVLVLLTPARLGDGDNGWLPRGFEPEEQQGVLVWKGQIAQVPLTLHAAVFGKVHREGGWDLAKRKPRDVVSLIPAGSCYYVTADGDLAAAAKDLHGESIGAEPHLGRGLIACGLWNMNEF